MKFLCDRCKTRYSIGDDRVRGKILKIRCKNCANVITVREGMSDVDASEPQDTGGRRNRPTTAAPLVAQSAALASRNPHRLASGNAQPKPPAALEEEWYVSIDGDQAGPYTLADAQQWVATKPFDAELHCWSEGFDDWLPVDKVSHFRGLRKRPASVSAPPPLPRIAPSASTPPVSASPSRPGTTSVAPIIPRDEDTPKPLFAATMASLEKNAPAESGSGLPPMGSLQMRGPVAQPSATPPHGVPANGANGSVTSHVSTSQGIGVIPATTPSFPSTNEASRPGTESARASFDTSEPSQSSIVGHQPLFDGKATDPLPAAPMEDNDLEFGDVSRVVRLADIARPPGPGRSTATPVATKAAVQVGRVTTPGTRAITSVGRATGTAAILADGTRKTGAYPTVEPAHHRRGLVMLLGVAGLLVLGVAVAVIYIVTQDSDDTSQLNNVSELNTDRPDELIVRPNIVQPGSNAQPQTKQGSGATVQHPRQNVTPTGPGPSAGSAQGSAQGSGQGKTETPPGPGSTVALRSDEIEDMYGKHKFGAERCYMRAQKDQFLGDVKRIQVMLTVDKDGAVTDVTLDSHKDDVLGKCLSNQVRSWKFRQSPGGSFRFTMAFAS